MATDNRTVIWGYIAPNWAVVEEIQYSPRSYTVAPPTINNRDGSENKTKAFSSAEAYKLMSDGYANMWDNVMATMYWDLANELWQFSGYANTAIWAYDNLLDFIAWNENRLQGVAGATYNKIVNDIKSQKDYVYDMFWPNGKLTKEVDSYYDDLWNYLATDAWRQAATIAAQWMHSWASLWAIRAQQNEAYNQSFARYVQAKEQQINAKQSIASNLINFMSTLRKEYWDTTNQYIIEIYKRAYDLYNKVAFSVISDIDSYNKLRYSSSWGGSWSSLDDLLKKLVDIDLTWKQDANENSNSKGGWIVNSESKGTGSSSEAGSSSAADKLWLTPTKWSKASNVDYVGGFIKNNPMYLMWYAYPKAIWDVAKNIWNGVKD